MHKLFAVILLLLVILVSCSLEGDKKNNDAVTYPLSQEKELKNELKKYPDSISLTEKLIEYYGNKGSYDTAINLTSAALSKDSGNVELWDILGTLEYQNGDTVNSIKAYETAINIYPLPEYIISLGTLYAQTKNPKALMMADALIMADMAKAAKEALFIKGLYYTYMNERKKAIIYFDSCIHNDYTYMYAYREKGIALYDMGKYPEAIEVLNRAVTIQNNFDEGYYWLGRCYEKTGVKDKAKENYQMALLYDKNFIEAKEGLERVK